MTDPNPFDQKLAGALRDLTRHAMASGRGAPSTDGGGVPAGTELEGPHHLAAGPTSPGGSRRSWWLGAAAVLVVALVAVVLVVRSDDGIVRTAQPGPPLDGVPAPTYVRDPLTEPEGWTAMADAPIRGRDDAITAWTGAELLVIRGNGAFSDGGGGEAGRTDGAAYDPRADRWRRIADSPFEARGSIMGADTVSAWTGKELLVWGGPEPRGAAYDPATDSWRDIDVGPLEARVGMTSVWTGSEWIVSGGIAHAAVLSYETEEDRADDVALTTGAAYDPVTGVWRPITPAPDGRIEGQAVWDGSAMITFGGYVPTRGDEPGPPAVAQAYDPVADSWRRLAAPPFQDSTGAVWTGTEVVAIVAGATDAEGNREEVDPVVTYDPEADRWTPVAGAPVPGTGTRGGPETSIANWIYPALVWTGTEVLFFGTGFTNPEQPQPLEGFALDVASRTWRELPPSGLTTRGGSSTAWIGDQLLLWGGAAYTGYTSSPYADGARYRPGPGR
ncbi:MAG TPA: hypothetical protein VNS19_15335 [Acidimicrobiales bacterium]|nr:hypothetical protein [Acidimicrobiales bacterium]